MLSGLINDDAIGPRNRFEQQTSGYVLLMNSKIGNNIA
jgi:hypothetical protein